MNHEKGRKNRVILYPGPGRAGAVVNGDLGIYHEKRHTAGYPHKSHDRRRGDGMRRVPAGHSDMHTHHSLNKPTVVHRPESTRFKAVIMVIEQVAIGLLLAVSLMWVLS